MKEAGCSAPCTARKNSPPNRAAVLTMVVPGRLVGAVSSLGVLTRTRRVKRVRVRRVGRVAISACHSLRQRARVGVGSSRVSMDSVRVVTEVVDLGWRTPRLHHPSSFGGWFAHHPPLIGVSVVQHGEEIVGHPADLGLF